MRATHFRLFLHCIPAVATHYSLRLLLVLGSDPCTANDYDGYSSTNVCERAKATVLNARMHLFCVPKQIAFRKYPYYQIHAQRMPVKFTFKRKNTTLLVQNSV